MCGTWRGGRSTKARLATQTNRDAMTSTWLGRSRELRETLTEGRLHCTSISPAGPRPLLNKTKLKERKGIKILFPGKYFISSLMYFFFLGGGGAL